MTSFICPNCNKELPETSRFCNLCGTILVKICPKCNKEIPLSSKFCSHCGVLIQEFEKIKESEISKKTSNPKFFQVPLLAKKTAGKFIRVIMTSQNNIIEQYKDRIDLLISKITTIAKENREKIYYKEILKFIDDEFRNESNKVKKNIKYTIFNNTNIQSLTGVSSIPLKHLALGWFKFYVYVRFPLGIIGGITRILTYSSFSKESSPAISLFLLFDVIIAGILLYGLRKHEYWAWKLNFYYLVLGSVLFSYTSPMAESMGIMGALIASLIITFVYLIPNWIYFKNRKYMFADLPSEEQLNFQCNGCGTYVSAKDPVCPKCGVEFYSEDEK
ncbi:MAG: zinc-ribbon domain-containing protein [Candidatus Latescibacteria bacterium]|nr:zinc-ribbon domain-containing protein [Candidatus Latescibacterota bacterium]